MQKIFKTLRDIWNREEIKDEVVLRPRSQLDFCVTGIYHEKEVTKLSHNSYNIATTSTITFSTAESNVFAYVEQARLHAAV